MKKFIINVFIVIVFVGFLECYGHTKPSNDLLAYQNKIVSIAGDDHSVVVQSQVNPICIFTPLTYAEIGDATLQKTYFFPRTRYADLKKSKLSLQLRDQLDAAGMSLRLEEVFGKNYGVRMIFTMQSCDTYDIEKFVDVDKKTVRFDFVKKM